MDKLKLDNVVMPTYSIDAHETFKIWGRKAHKTKRRNFTAVHMYTTQARHSIKSIVQSCHVTKITWE